ncbi:MAG TPA: hypothetical protein VM802_08840 [Chitinophaga sp.]|uniref:hypothetical protein n=1 Tax=Chitinophaga sp. TaxID=1869181 RepID=UPI002C7B3029|nr:hypothetical protein [Chitinophaga sp.]HVI44964.1 hypothetical protein [Chitinophaga sp.]
MKAECLYQLMTEKLAGIISAAYEQMLDEMLEKDRSVQAFWKEVNTAGMPDGHYTWKQVSRMPKITTSKNRSPLSWLLSSLRGMK